MKMFDTLLDQLKLYEPPAWCSVELDKGYDFADVHTSIRKAGLSESITRRGSGILAYNQSHRWRVEGANAQLKCLRRLAGSYGRSDRVRAAWLSLGAAVVIVKMLLRSAGRRLR